MASHTVPPELPGLGTSWYARGGRYWTRRVVSFVVFTLVIAGFDALAVDLWRGFSDGMPHGTRTALGTVLAVLCAGAAVWGWVVRRRSFRRQRAQESGPAARGERGASVARTTGLALAGRIVIVVLGPFLAPFAAFATGWLLSALTVAEYPSETLARRALAAAGHAPHPER